VAKEKVPMTPALRILKSSGVDFSIFQFRYEGKGATATAARELNRPAHEIVKTLVFEDDRQTPFLVLMHGDRQVSTKTLARLLGTKTIKPCEPAQADKHTGYKVGGISPFGTRKKMPVYIEESIMNLDRIIINGGKRGLVVEMSPEDVVRILGAQKVNTSI
jgi:Cys-tRNA(Pro) deacylase